jgi:hypothetical protein
VLEAIGAAPNEGGNLLALGPAYPGLAPYFDGTPARRRGEPKPLPSPAQIDGWASALLSSGEPLAYLLERRKLSLPIVCRYLLGWDRTRGDLTFPVFSGQLRRGVVNLYRRKPADGANMRALRGWPRAPYPNLPARRWLLLVAGEIDALTGRQLGFPAVTVSGCALPDHSLPLFRNRVVYVMFDAGREEEAAERVAAKLSEAGAIAYVIRLSRLGLAEDADLNDYSREGGSSEELVQLIKDERRKQC